MTDFTVAVDLIPDTADNVDYAVSVGDGRTFRLGFARDLLGVWEAELARSDHALQLDRLADDLAREILQLAPSDEQLSEGFLVALDKPEFRRFSCAAGTNRNGARRAVG
jgi:hypothetical protein